MASWLPVEATGLVEATRKQPGRLVASWLPVEATRKQPGRLVASWLPVEATGLVEATRKQPGGLGGWGYNQVGVTAVGWMVGVTTLLEVGVTASG